ncbi:alpha/beta hydrolase [Enhygromyxa salina]|uniref:Esterase YqiA n=1 Tax=Enhygromyxa salina TaxID=215803 RepID=A0A2S9YLX8_9BACT|nr:YqiA/YcfP family alpha/beta fold hydrolase [Enhygromyxa salina]PRQ06104.1 esterase YqiA [Enhygromyxa salina]
MRIRHAYLHGFASSPQARKGQALRSYYAEQGIDLHTPDLNAPSFAALTYTGMLDALDSLDSELDATEGVEPGSSRWRFVGSSMGGYLAARWASLHPERVDRLLLLCPAFDFAARWPQILGQAGFDRWREQGSFLLPDATGTPVNVHFGLVEDAMTHPARPVVSCPTMIIHGTQDVVVPIESSRRYVQEHPEPSLVELIEVDDAHPLTDSLPTIQACAQRHLIAPRPVLYWDFFGPAAQGTAEHFHRHLDEFLAREGLPVGDEGCETGLVVVEPGRHAAATCRCPESLVAVIGRALRPHRVE